MAGSLALSLRNVYETFAICFPTVLEQARGKLTKETCDRRLDGWSRACLENAHVNLHVTGREHLSDGKTYLVMSNHRSLYDIPVLFQAIGPNLRMVAKKELFRVPFFGGALDAAGFVRIDRGDRSSAIRSLGQGRDLLHGGVHVWIAPEGTRSRTGELLPFKKGAFYLAFEAGMPVLPVTMLGTQDVLRADGVRSNEGASVRVVVHDPIDAVPFASQGKPGRQALMDEVRRVIGSAL